MVQKDAFGDPSCNEPRIKHESEEFHDELLEIKAEPESLEQKCDIAQFNENEYYSQTNGRQADLILLTSKDPFSINKYIQHTSKLRPILPKIHENCNLNDMTVDAHQLSKKQQEMHNK